jgi:hypothetical protein
LVSFQDIYAAVPGDMINATTRVPGCAASCINGNGDSIVGTSGAAAGDTTIQSGAAVPGAEGLLFWKHLALADLISGVDTTAALAANLTPGSTNPKSPYGGALNIFSSAGATYQPGLVIMVSNVTVAGAYAGVAGQRVLPALRLSQIDTKLDDGRADAGSVEGTPIGAAAAAAAGECSGSTGVYANSKIKDCNLAFALGY